MMVSRGEARIYIVEKNKGLLNLYPGANAQSKYRKKGEHTKIYQVRLLCCSRTFEVSFMSSDLQMMALLHV